MEGTTWTVGERYRGWRLDRFLAEMVPKLSRTRIQKAITERIRVSWSGEVSPGMKVHVGGTIFAGFPRLFEIPENFEFPILFEDDELLAINKPAGMAVHPTNSSRVNTVIEALRRMRDSPDLTLTHRLDRETSGILLLAKNREAARECGRAFVQRTLSKTYLARVLSAPKEDSGTIDQPLGKDDRSPVFVRRRVLPGGENAVTEYRTLVREEGFSVLELRPRTGRRHQLRVHCDWMGCPIVGDPLYGRPDSEYLAIVRGERKPSRLQLHAWKLTGPIGPRTIDLRSPLPDFLDPQCFPNL